MPAERRASAAARHRRRAHRDRRAHRRSNERQQRRSRSDLDGCRGRAGAEAATFVLGAAAAGLAVWLVTRTAPVVPDVQRLNVALAAGHAARGRARSRPPDAGASRDGTRLAFVTRGAGGRKQIHLRRLDSVTLSPCRHRGRRHAVLLARRRLARLRGRRQTLRVPVAGGQPIVICDAPEPRGASWGEDGTIVFAAGVFSGLSRVSVTVGHPCR